MATIDDKVVAISFESSKFESGVNRAIASLELLKKTLNFPSAGKGFDDINAASKRVDLGHIAKGVEGIKGALESLRLVAIGVFSQLATQAVRAAGQFVKAFTLDPIKAGFAEYSTNLNAVQTILANTQAAGVGLKEVNATLKELNEYSDKTIYNFGQMAKNIGTFTAAGVDLDTATASIKGIANLAALSGSNSEQASTAMYQLSQAISAGRVSLMDWNSVVNAGMGGTVFQRALAQTAEAMGTLKEGTVKLVGPMKNVTIAGETFRNSVSTKPGEESWLTSKVLTTTLKQFTGDLKDAELAAMGFNKQQIKAIQQTAQTAMHAATEVKTIAQVFDVAKETAGSGWAATFQIIFGTFEEAKTTFTELSNTINGFINTNADARNKVLADWKALGGRTVLINSIKTAFHNLGMIVKPIKDAFRDIFPAKTGKDLYNLTLRFRDFANALKPSEQTVANLKRTFAGLFAVFSIAKQIIGGILGVFKTLFSTIFAGSGGFLDFTAKIGDFFVRLDKSLKKGDGLTKFFEGLGEVLALPIKLLQKFVEVLGDLSSQFSSGGISGKMADMTGSMNPFAALLEKIGEIAPKVAENIREMFAAMKPAFDAYMELLGGFGKAIGEAASNMNFDAILQVIKVGLLGGLVLLLKKFLGKGSLVEQLMGGFSGLTGGIFGSIAGSFRALEGSMVAMQQNIKAKTLKEIAIAIALLAASVVALSFVDPDKLNQSLTAITVMMGQLLGAMAIMGKISKSGGFLKLPIVAAGLILFAGAIDVLTIAVFALSRLSWSELIKGLGGVGALMGGLVIAVKPLSAGSPGLVRASVGLIAIAIALNLMALAVRQMGSMDLGALAKGLGGVAVALGTLVAATNKIPKGGMIGIGVGLIAVAAALLIMSKAVESFGGMSLMTLGKGLAGVGASLVIIGLAMRLMPKNMVLTGAGLVVVAAALNLLVKAIEKMGGMSLSEIAKGLGVLAGSLIILGVAMAAMSGMIVGAAALSIAAAGIFMLSGALKSMGSMSWGSMLKSLIMLAAALTIIGVAGALITPAIPGLLGLGLALLAIGAGLALAGAGIFLIATGLSALIVALPTGVGVLIAALQELQRGLIENAKLLALGILEVVRAFAATAPQFVEAMVKILNSLLDGIMQIMPKLQELIGVLITTLIAVLDQNQDRLIQAGLDLLIALLNGIKNNIGLIVTMVAQIIINIVNALRNKLGAIITAGANLLLSLIKGIVSIYPRVVTAILQIITKMLTTIASNLGKFVAAGLSILTKLLQAISSNLGKVITAGVDIIVAFVKGIGQAGERIVVAARQAAGKFINTLAQQIVKMSDEVFTAMITLINGLATVIENRAPELRRAGVKLGLAIIDGVTGGVISAAGDLYSKITSVMDHAMSLVKKIPLIGSPSKVTMDIGENIVLGLVVGIDKAAPQAYNSAVAMSNKVIDGFNDTLKTHSPSEVMIEIGKFVGQGFAQGLRSTKEDIKAAFSELQEKLTEAMKTARETIIEEEKKLKELREATKPDAAAIAAAQKAIATNQALLERSIAGHKLLTVALDGEKAKLLSLAGQMEVVNTKLEKAQEALKAAQQARADYQKSITEQYSTLPEIADLTAEAIAEANLKISESQTALNKVMAEEPGNIEKIKQAEADLAASKQAYADLTKDVVLNAEGTEVDKVATYMKQLQDQAAAVAAYGATLEQLRALGMDDATYQKLLEEGTADQEFATALLAGGKTAVEGLNQLDLDLEREAKKLGKSSARNLYGPGVEAAKGFLRGLKSQKARLIEEVEALADQIIAAFNKRLEIKSPSQVFAEAGKNVMLGFAKGITNSSRTITDAVDSAATDALNAMKSSMRKVSDVVTSELNPNPVITPILDLTQVRAQAGELGALTQVTPITAAASYGQASLISSAQLASQTDQEVVAPGATSVKFEQNNYSPEALTEIEIYRQTKNQLSQLKSALSLT